MEQNEIHHDYRVLTQREVESLQSAYVKKTQKRVEKILQEEISDHPDLRDAAADLLSYAEDQDIHLHDEDLLRHLEGGAESLQAYKNFLIRERDLCPQAREHYFTRRQERKFNRAASKRQDPEQIEKVFEAKSRIYIEPKVTGKSYTHKCVENALSDIGYIITVYKAGKATDKNGKQSFRIGKLLKDNVYLLSRFQTDPTRFTEKMLIVISRQPDDLARMSTGRQGWQSCLSANGIYAHYLPRQIENGALIAYLTTKNDPDLNKPVSRVLINPFIKDTLPNTGGFYGSAFKYVASRLNKPQDENYAYVVERRIYGLNQSYLREITEKFFQEHVNSPTLNGEFSLRSNLYRDSFPIRTIKNGEISFGASGPF